MASEPSAKRAHFERGLAAALALLLLAAAARGLGVTAESLWQDETFLTLYAQRPITDLLPFAWDPHPPLYYLIMRGWMAVAGTSELALRWPSALADLLGVALVYATTRRLARGARRPALAAAALYALAPMAVWYGQEARMYAAAAMMVCAAGLAALHGRWRAFALLALLALYTHYTAVVAVGIVAVALVAGVQWPRAVENARAQRRAPLAAVLVVAAGFAPWLPRLYEQAAGLDGLWTRAAPWLARIGIAGGEAQVAAASLAAGVLGALLAVPALAWLVRALPRVPGAQRWWTAGLGALWLAFTLWGSIDGATTVRRQLVVLLPWITVAFTLALWRGGRAQKAAGVVWAACALLSAACLLYNAVTPQKEQWREAAARITREEQAGDLVVVVPDWSQRSLEYYYHGPAPRGVPGGIDQASFLEQKDFAHFPRVWLILYNSALFEPTGRAGGWFDEHMRRDAVFYFYKIELRLYTRAR